MELPTKEVLFKFPIDQVIFIVSSGLTFTLCFPFDILSLDFTNGLPVSNVGNFGDFSYWITQNYKPFIIVKYLDFPNGIIQIVLLSLVPGLMMFFLQDVFYWANHKIVRGKLKEKLGITSLSRDPVERELIDAKHIKWLKKQNALKYFGFLWTLKFATRGSLYAFEASVVMGLAAMIISVAGSHQLPPYAFSFRFFAVLILGLSIYAVYLVYEVQLDKRNKRLFNELDKENENKSEENSPSPKSE